MGTENRVELKKEYHRNWRNKNREHLLAYRKEWRKKNPEKARAISRKHYAKKKKESPEQQLSKERLWRGLPVPTRKCCATCECCGVELHKTPHLDHNHITHKFRGWLCSKCNKGIGLLGDSLEGISKAKEYLERTG